MSAYAFAADEVDLAVAVQVGDRDQVGERPDREPTCPATCLYRCSGARRRFYCHGSAVARSALPSAFQVPDRDRPRADAPAGNPMAGRD